MPPTSSLTISASLIAEPLPIVEVDTSNVTGRTTTEIAQLEIHGGVRLYNKGRKTGHTFSEANKPKRVLPSLLGNHPLAVQR